MSRRTPRRGVPTDARRLSDKTHLPLPGRPPSLPAMATQELYIRNATETEARGPFNTQQVADLAEAGQVTADTLIYDAATEQWVALNSNADLMAGIFSRKKKLNPKGKENKNLNKKDETAETNTGKNMT